MAARQLRLRVACRHTDEVAEGSGTVDDPYQCYAFGGCCTITTRRALAEVGFLNTRFIGYGWGHVEWTHRYRLRYRDNWGLADKTVPCLNHGVRIAGRVETYRNEEDFERNKKLYAEIRAHREDEDYRVPWGNDDEATRLKCEIAKLRPFNRLNREINGPNRDARGPHIEIIQAATPVMRK